MDAEGFYRYLMHTRRRLWDTLRQVPDEDLSRPLLPGDGPRCIKDLVAHIPAVEDGWFRADLLGQPMVQDTLGRTPHSADAYWHHEHEPLGDLLGYWEAVETDTLQRWPALMTAAQADRRVPVDESRPETISPDEVLWHVMQHEVRHSAQIVTMLRLLGHQPPALDLVFLAAQ
ncbi:DinB family protein [Deinococcus maricopensis]|uniref:DinB family protein n=1 Tax=Deinococcus maricopensis (strain DSM 21211 / LMG 22137 / NRRL B-23946 / LB-34) TaxID=709986 RepID=E8U4T8_DEIML|nr:DinB family protein [Deinococcus maricopensis]ADV66077.1 DinB family protein [Deinococcus maricopensis DSM 21211]